jgi:hypothetical protein
MLLFVVSWSISGESDERTRWMALTENECIFDEGVSIGASERYAARKRTDTDQYC